MMTFQEIFDERCINIRAFSRSVGLPATTLYSIRDGKTNPHKISITAWLKIAHGLGMTGDELYEVVFGEENGEA